MPLVDKNAPIATNSDAAMWRQDHASAIRYIEALLAERKRWAEVIEAIKIKVAKREAHMATYGKPYRAENEHLFRERMDAEYDLEEKIAAALKEGNADES